MVSWSEHEKREFSHGQGMVTMVTSKIEHRSHGRGVPLVPEVSFFYFNPAVPVAVVIVCDKKIHDGKIVWHTVISLSYAADVDIEGQFFQEFTGGFLDEGDWTTNRPSMFAAEFVTALKAHGIEYDDSVKSWCSALNSKLAEAVSKGKKGGIPPSRLMLRTTSVESFSPERLDIHMSLDSPFRIAGKAFRTPNSLNLFLRQRLGDYETVTETTYDMLLNFWKQIAIERPIQEDPLAALLVEALVQRLLRFSILRNFSSDAYDAITNTNQAAVLHGDALFITSSLFAEVLEDLSLKRDAAMVTLAPYLASAKYESRHLRKEGRKDISKTFLKISWPAIVRTFPQLEGAVRSPGTDEDHAAKSVLSDLIPGKIVGSIDETGMCSVNEMPAFLCSDNGVSHFHVAAIPKPDDCHGAFFQIETTTFLLVRAGTVDSSLPFNEIVQRDIVGGIFLEQPAIRDAENEKRS